MRTRTAARAQKTVKAALIYAALILLAAIILLPFYFMVITSFKTESEAAGVFTWWPGEFTLAGYQKVLGENVFEISIYKSLLNTLKIVLPVLLVGLFISAMSAYCFAKRKFTGKNVLFWILLCTMMIPGAVTMIPSYMIFNKLEWVGTPLPLMLPGMFGSATCIFFLRQYFSGLPDSLVEAGKLDGMNHFGIFIKIALPLAVPAVVSQAILWFIAGYNDYISPLIYLQDQEQYTLQIALAFFNSEMGGNIPVALAGSLLTLTIPLALYVAFQRFFISGIIVSGIKA